MGSTEKPKSLKGQLLLDGGKLRESFFHQTVVLICQHDPDGAFGLVLNRPSDKEVGDVLAAQLPEALKQQRLFYGGPVQPEALSFLHTDSFLPEGNVMANLQLAHSLDSLVEVGESFSPTQQVRIFAGYAGWSAGQLDDEMRRQAWLTHPASLELVFHAEPGGLWRKILRLKGWEYRLLAETPEDLSRN
ncbi:MAG: YqgE/AlgH family protein [Verrucomicrobia bacterium]|nr:YqgE/AlgH family protein [Verrucomicrobiota bacterium]